MRPVHAALLRLHELRGVLGRHPARAAAEAGGGELEVMKLAADDRRDLA
jgi:hypothetical protein